MIEMCNMCHLYRELNDEGMCKECEDSLIKELDQMKKDDLDYAKAIRIDGIK